MILKKPPKAHVILAPQSLQSPQNPQSPLKSSESLRKHTPSSPLKTRKTPSKAPKASESARHPRPAKTRKAPSKPPQIAEIPHTKTQKKRAAKIAALFCTRSRDRTGTVLLPLVFETNASTNSAIRADALFRKGVAKIRRFFQSPNFSTSFLKKSFIFFALALPTKPDSSSIWAALILATVRKWCMRVSIVFAPIP